ncbi:helix-turn-helix domain-containing protein [Mucilaginibacter sp. cycad4]|uniref:helix-turn-helix domain-containing protein n=1 Tax=Mucilaginibacter sp. cycad4 TaxID=3342096 RepID=UPI002AAABB47|nr:helix-turn-helix domain-containing protein [Mucilaginibacter gossypii]WPU99119.1 helix-turn-helix domain-containing protein [Mucilaginibacter gossypii]
MNLEVLTVDDLEKFRQQLLTDIKDLLQPKQYQKRWLKTADVMKMLGMSEVTLQTLRKQGKIPFKKLRGVCYYDAEELDDYLSSL